MDTSAFSRSLVQSFDERNIFGAHGKAISQGHIRDFARFCVDALRVFCSAIKGVDTRNNAIIVRLCAISR